MQIVFASNNPGKVDEVSALLRVFGHNVVGPDYWGIHIDTEETGTSLQENALLKVQAARDTLPIEDDAPIIADDTGLLIDALGGEPGIYVRRWRDKNSEMTDNEIVEYCMQRMQGITDRRARIQTVVALSWRGNVEYLYGDLPGVIVDTPGDMLIPGFPLEPLFWVSEWGMLLGEQHTLSDEERARLLTHRGRAIAAVVEHLKNAA